MYCDSQRVGEQAVINELEYCKFYVKDPRNDGFTGWAQKQKVYRIMWHAQQVLKQMPSFAGEDEWVEDQQVQSAFQELSK